MTMFDGFRAGTISMATDKGRRERPGCLLHDSGLGLSTFVGTEDLEPGNSFVVFNITHLASGLRVVAIIASIGEAMRVFTEIAALTDWTAQHPEGVLGIKSSIEAITAGMRWRGPEPDPLYIPAALNG